MAARGRISTDMLPFTEHGCGEPTLVMMPFLGGGQREWTEVVLLLIRNYRCITLDLPGFGAASAVPGYSVGEMADAVIKTLSAMEINRYILIGHSMAGKVAAVVTRKLREDRGSLRSPFGLVLVAPSPPAPEPMSDSKRAEMLKALGNQTQLDRGGYGETDRAAAGKFVQDNVASALAEPVFQRTVEDVLQMNPAAWVAWLENGSKEDWASFVGTLDLPTLLVAATQDGSLGPDAQRKQTLPHFSAARLAEVDCSHLIPLEATRGLAILISDFINQFGQGVRL